jgi:AhpD family alkylhydroperoxidase
MNARLDYNSSEVLQKFAKHLIAASAALQQAALPAATANLVLIRASQINGCSVCLDMHTKDAERAALELTEQGTRIADGAGGVTDEAWADAAKHYDTEQLAALVGTIALINTFNRLNVISRSEGGDYKPGQWG